jgi:hypothetical protein
MVAGQGGKLHRHQPSTARFVGHRATLPIASATQPDDAEIRTRASKWSICDHRGAHAAMDCDWRWPQRRELSR